MPGHIMIGINLGQWFYLTRYTPKIRVRPYNLVLGAFVKDLLRKAFLMTSCPMSPYALLHVCLFLRPGRTVWNCVRTLCVGIQLSTIAGRGP